MAGLFVRHLATAFLAERPVELLGIYSVSHGENYSSQDLNLHLCRAFLS